jgi:hypothetical protein
MPRERISADHHRDGTAAQRFLIAHSKSRPRPAATVISRSGAMPAPSRPGSIGRTVLREREIFGDPEHVFFGNAGEAPA